MFKFCAGLVLGLAIGAVFFRYQVKKVDAYSFKIGYMSGRVDADQSAIPVACRIYKGYHYSAQVPFGYTPGPADAELKELCQNPPSSTIQLSPEQ